MAGLYTELLRHEFTSSASFSITHNLGRQNLFARVIVGNVARQDLLISLTPAPLDPSNSLAVVLLSVQTGIIQILSHDIVTVTPDTDGTPGSATQVGELMYGTLLDYPSAAGMAAGEIQYIQRTLTLGTILSGASTFVDSGGSALRHVRFGLYDQTDPEDSAGLPVTRLTQTAQLVTTGDGTIAGDWEGGGTIPNDFTIQISGFYWLAMVADSTTVKFASTSSHRGGFLPVAREDPGATADLPATAGTTTNPVSALSFMTLTLAPHD